MFLQNSFVCLIHKELLYMFKALNETSSYLQQLDASSVVFWQLCCKKTGTC